MPLPVITIAEMREWERATWATGQTESGVIERVGRKVARLALRMTQPGNSILLLAGKGNNGADAQASQAHLHERQTRLLNISDPDADHTTLEAALSASPDLVVDGLFGIGLNRPLSEGWIRLIQMINKTHHPVLSVDVPSGLNADTGQTYGDAVRAQATLAVGAIKKGMLLEPSWPYVGRIAVAIDVGLIPCPCASELNWAREADFAHYPPARPVTAHKGTSGHLAIVAGSVGFHGAAVLAARGAQRAQPGLITLHTPESAYPVVAPHLQAVMVSPWDLDTKLPGPWTAFLLGPGLASPNLPDQIKLLTRLLWRDSTLPVVVDASALDWLPLDLTPRNAIRVLTPHPGEAARMLRTTPQKIQSDRPAALREISRRYANAWVVLKGHQTLVGRSTGDLYVNTSGNPYLGQGGSGDVLSGYIGGLLAQPALQGDVAAALRFAVWQHGATADRLEITNRNWIVEDLVREIGNVRPEPL